MKAPLFRLFVACIVAVLLVALWVFSKADGEPPVTGISYPGVSNGQ